MNLKLDIAIAPDELLGKKGSSAYENPDKVINTKGLSYIVNEVERDTQVSSALETRTNHLIKKGYTIWPAQVNGQVPKLAYEAAEFTRYALNNMSSDFITDIYAFMYSALSQGYSLSEINWQLINAGQFKNKLGIESIRLKPQQYFSFEFDKYARYVLKQVDPVEKKLPLEKFIHYIHGSNDENPYGESLSSKAAFYVWFKKNGFAFWCRHLDHYADPIPEVKTPSDVGAPKEKEFKGQATQLIQNIKSGRGIVVPKNLEVGFLQANNNGVSSYDQFIDRANREISKLILGQTLTSESAKGGSTHALGTVHEGVLQSYAQRDVMVSEAVINKQLIQRLNNYNYPPEVCPVFRWNNTINIASVQAIEGLLRTGLNISQEYVYNILGIPVPKPNEKVLTPIPAKSANQEGGIDNKAKKSYQQNTNPVFFQVAHKKQVTKNEKVIKKAAQILAKNWHNVQQELINNKKIKTSPKAFTKTIQPHILNFLAIAKVFGKNSVKTEVNKKYSNLEQVSLFAEEPLQHLINQLIARKVVTKTEFNKLKKELKAESFTVAGLEAETIEKIKIELEPVLVGTKTTKELQAKVNTYFANKGLTKLSPWHLETVVRNNLQIHYNKARKEVFEKLDISDFPQLQVSCIVDDTTRPSHAALNGYTALKNDPIWQVLVPPFDHNCRCQVRAVHADEQLNNTKKSPNIKDLGFIGG